MRTDSTRLLLAGVAVSATLHAFIGARLGSVAPVVRSEQSAHVEFQIAPAPPAPEPPAPEPPAPEPPPLPAIETHRPPPPRLAVVPESEAKPAPTTPAESEAAAPEAPDTPSAAELSGATLSSEAGAFDVPLSDGTTRRGPISARKPTARRRKAPPRSARASTVERPRVVALSDLSTKPRAPQLNAALRQNYPASARAQGRGGEATVQVLIGPDGLARGVRVLSESAAGFGLACRRTVQGSRWGAPRDRDGRAVTTQIVYRCRFRVER
jgi:TonB family protein